MKVTVLDNDEAQIRKAELYSEQVISCSTLEEFIEVTPQPRVIWLMLPAGSITNSIVEELTQKLSAGDILIDGGNSYYKDNLQQNEKLKAKKIDFFDVGTSGEWLVHVRGNFMIGGDSKNLGKNWNPSFKIGPKRWLSLYRSAWKWPLS